MTPASKITKFMLVSTPAALLTVEYARSDKRSMVNAPVSQKTNPCSMLIRFHQILNLLIFSPVGSKVAPVRDRFSFFPDKMFVICPEYEPIPYPFSLAYKD